MPPKNAEEIINTYLTPILGDFNKKFLNRVWNQMHNILKQKIIQFHQNLNLRNSEASSGKFVVK